MRDYELTIRAEFAKIIRKLHADAMKEGIACNYRPVLDWIIPVLAECEMSRNINKDPVSHTKDFFEACQKLRLHNLTVRSCRSQQGELKDGSSSCQSKSR